MTFDAGLYDDHPDAGAAMDNNTEQALRAIHERLSGIEKTLNLFQWPVLIAVILLGVIAYRIH